MRVRELKQIKSLIVAEKPTNVDISGLSVLTNKGRTIYNPVPNQMSKESSGLMIGFDDKQTALYAAPYLESRLFRRTFVSLLYGHMPFDTYHVRQNISKPILGETRMRIARNSTEGKSAYSIVEPLHHGYVFGRKVTVAELRPVTAIRHQLRIHAALLGYPIIGDELYAKAYSPDTEMINERNTYKDEGTASEALLRHLEVNKWQALMLHCWRLRFFAAPQSIFADWPSLDEMNVINKGDFDKLIVDESMEEPLTAFLDKHGLVAPMHGKDSKLLDAATKVEGDHESVHSPSEAAKRLMNLNAERIAAMEQAAKDIGLKGSGYARLVEKLKK